VRMMSGLPVYTPFGTYYFEDPQIRELSISKYFSEKYSKIKLSSLNELFEAQEEMFDHLDEIAVPVLLIYSEKDKVIPNSHAYQIYDQLGSTDKELVWVDNSDHILTIDFARDVVAGLVREFITDRNVD